MTPEGLAKLIIMEGEVLHAYQDHLGYWTIGVGHLIDKRRGGGISQRVSRIMLTNDVEKATAQCRQAFDWIDLLDPVRQDVIIQLCFNMGLAGLKTFKDFLAACEKQDWTMAVNELLDSKWAKQVQKERVDDLVNAIEYGVWD